MMRLLAVPLVLLVAGTAPGADKSRVDFARQVRPILAENCFKCHGPDKKARRGGLRLDTREGAIAELDSGLKAIIPGNPKTSELVNRIKSDEPGMRMPPVASKKRLTKQQKEILERWVAQGADYALHWAYIPPRRHPLPSVKDASWACNPIDLFVLARLEKAGLKPSPEADRRSWIRRVSLDLTGLPPTLAEVEAFVTDRSPLAYGRVVDRLLASTAYGERWGRVWLDLARYADSAGYAQDPPRTIWRYRDWVIRSLNAGMPFDQFTIEQIAGDLLPGATEDQLLATAFHRNTMTNSEGGTDDEEFRNAAVIDRVNTTMQVWMGMTMGCAQCHDHKYDPISQEEYFRFFAILNNTEDADRGDESPTLVLLTPEQLAQRKRLQADIARLEQEVARQAKPTGGKKPPVPSPGPLRTRYLRVELMGKGVFLSLAEVQAFAGSRNVAREGKASQVSTDYDGPARLAIDGNTNGDFVAAKSTTHTARADNPWWEVDLGGAHTLDRVVLWNRTDGNTSARLKPFRVVALDEKRQPLWVKTIRQAPNPSVELPLPKSGEEVDVKSRAEVARYLAGGSSADSPEMKRLAALKKELAAIKGVPTPVMRELPANRRRKTHIQLRGNFMNKGKEVSAGVPSAFQPLPRGAEANRLGLARWLVSRDNPLTARVAVNRLWEELFGIGIVETSEDFGVQGEPPSHPELLDWLAVELMENGWDIKRLLRTIVLSSAYRQSSKVTPELLEKDPGNRLLSRGPRFRLSAEAVRDQALAVSGLLSRKIGGPSVQPPRPVLGLRSAFGGSTDWTTSPGDDRYRRGLYTSWRRTTPYPSMTTFDAPSREVCTVRRIRTNTPLQALVTLNDPVYVEAAQALARRLVSKGGATVKERAAYGFRLCLSRPPADRELSRLAGLYEQALARFRKAPADAMKLATDPLGPAPKGMDMAELAAWTVVGNVLMNLDEFLARR
jgi:Protein of unknown function (DUF1553)/Protein of unknown function (DUF1549)/Planctomycete cytochrome C/NedA-like, galactose-binding domain